MFTNKNVSLSYQHPACAHCICLRGCEATCVGLAFFGLSASGKSSFYYLACIAFLSARLCFLSDFAAVNESSVFHQILGKH